MPECGKRWRKRCTMRCTRMTSERQTRESVRSACVGREVNVRGLHVVAHSMLSVIPLRADTHIVQTTSRQQKTSTTTADMDAHTARRTCTKLDGLVLSYQSFLLLVGTFPVIYSFDMTATGSLLQKTVTAKQNLISTKEEQEEKNQPKNRRFFRMKGYRSFWSFICFQRRG